tara:strand:- start:1057 stop:1749 length:693 start_codon:yes stop_codon:yes gene_type:complete
MNKYILKNYEWWNEPDDTYSPNTIAGGYKKSDIITENPKYNIDLLKKINKFVITTDSQQREYIHARQPLIKDFIEFMSHSRNLAKSSLMKNCIIDTTQVPYLELVTTTENSHKIYEFLKDSNVYGIFRKDYGETQQINRKMRAMYKCDDLRFKGSCFGMEVALTYHRLENSVFNERYKIWDNWVVPTIFSEHVYSKFFDNGLYSKDSSMLFIVGGDSMNSLFQDLLNVFS